MKRFFASLLLGMAAGIVDVLPMIPLRTGRAAMVSAFLHWLVLGVLITYLRAPLSAWMKGLAVGLASALPVVSMVFPSDPTSVPPILVMSALLGSAVGFSAGRIAILRES